jgi:hypothetical protein
MQWTAGIASIRLAGDPDIDAEMRLVGLVFRCFEKRIGSAPAQALALDDTP